ncbi:MAG: HAMP domain-containing protein, partial [Pseudomonas fluorescens]|nr:HAMP domain-containing protein [Pseudomonas fluorescens]
MLTNISHWLGRLSVGRKLTLIYLLDLSAVIYVSSILIHEKFLAIDFARKEVVGTAYTEVVRRNLMDAFIVPPVPLADSQSNRQELQRVRSLYDAELHTEEPAERFSQLLAGPKGLNDAQKAKLLGPGRDLLTTVGNQSNLILDPDLDSYYVMSLTVLRFPELLQVLFETRQFMQGWGVRVPGHNQTAELLTLVGRLDAVLIGIESDYGQAWAAGSPQLKAALGSSRMALMKAAREFGAVVQEASGHDLSAVQIAALDMPYQAALSTLNNTWRIGIVEMQGLLDMRIDSLFSRMWLHLGTALLLLGCILSLVYLVASQIARPLQALARVADDVRNSADYTRRATWHSRDEIGQLFTAFNGMLAQLDRDRLAQQELAASARAAEAQRELVEAFPIPMVVTSVPDHEILHANTP